MSQGQLASYADLKKNYSSNSTVINKLRDGSAPVGKSDSPAIEAAAEHYTRIAIHRGR